MSFVVGQGCRQGGVAPKAEGCPFTSRASEELVKRNTAAGQFPPLHQPAPGKESETSDVVFIAVPTPPMPDGSVDLSFIEGVSREIAGTMNAYKIIVDKSTVPVKTGQKVAETIKRYCKSKVDFDVVSNPEFLARGIRGGRFGEARPGWSLAWRRPAPCNR